MANVPLVRKAIVGAALAHNTPPPSPLVVDPVQVDQWTPAALERAGSTLKALNRMAKRPPVHILFEDVTYTVSSSSGKWILFIMFNYSLESNQLPTIYITYSNGRD